MVFTGAAPGPIRGLPPHSGAPPPGAGESSGLLAARSHPHEAVVTLRAYGSLADVEVACSGDMLVQALVACAGVTLRSGATNRGIEVTGS